MSEMSELYLITLTLVVVIGIACQIFAWRVKMPAILFLLLTGFIAGPVLEAIDPDLLFGDLLFPIVSLGVAIILFEGSLTLRFHDISKNPSVVWRLVSIGMLITFAAAAAAAYHLGNVSMPISLLFGAIVTVTGPTVIMPLLRSVRPTPEVSNILRWESIVIDPIGAIMAVLVFEYVTMDDISDLWGTLGRLFVSGVLVGGFCAAILTHVVKRNAIPDYLMKVSILAYVVGVYTFCDFIQPESGLLAVTIMGIYLANQKGIYLEEILDFKESLSILIISGLFIVLAARMDISTLTQAGWSGGLILLAIIIARPISVFFSTIGSSLNWRERTLVGWIAPRGIIAAAIAPLFALKLEAKGFEDAEMLTSLVFLIIVGTVVIQSLTAGPLSRILKVSEPEPSGVLIVGANKLARAIGVALKEARFNVLLADTDWDRVSKARMLGLKAFFGNVVSEHADRHMDLMGIGKLLAMSPSPNINALAAVRYRREFGGNNIYVIKTEAEELARDKDIISEDYTAPCLFSGEITQKQISDMLDQGYEIHATQLTEEFDYTAYMKLNEGKSLPLFAVTKRHKLVPYIEKTNVIPEAGWTVISMVPEDQVPSVKT